MNTNKEGPGASRALNLTAPNSGNNVPGQSGQVNSIPADNEGGSVFNRPGVSDEFLIKAGCCHVGADQCVDLYGCRAEGIAIPFRSLDGQPIMDGGKPFARVRLYDPTESQKYHQRAGSQPHIYVSPNFGELPRGATLIIVEGEFKSLALAEAGFAAIGLPGINGAMHKVDGEPRLHNELVEVLKFHQPARVLFLGDSDTVFNSEFSREAAKLRKALFDSKRFSFIQELRIAVCPLDGLKGADDVRGVMGSEFNTWFTALADNAFVVPAKASPTQIFCKLLRGWSDLVRAAITSGDDGEQHRNRVKLLQGAARLQHEPGAMLLLRPLLTDLLNVKDTKLDRMIRDAGESKTDGDDQQDHAKENLQGGAVNLADVEPWPQPVDGASALNEVADTFNRYAVLPDGAADAIALWCAHAHVFEAFTCSPRLNIGSPEKGCGKTTTRDVTAEFVPRPLLTENLSVAVLFRVTEKHKPTLLADECDSWLRDNEELRGMLNAGHRRGGQALRCEGDSNEVRAFNVFAPAVLCGIGSLPGTLHDRSIVIRLERAKPGELRERFDSRHTQKEKELCRKLARFCADSKSRLESCDPELPPGVFNRMADNWRPLFAIAQVAGRDWPARAVASFSKLTSRDDADAQGIGAMLLADIRQTYIEARAVRLFSKSIVDGLRGMTDRPWPEAHHGKPITETWIARRLRSFGIVPHTLRIGEERFKGYELTDFADALDRYVLAPGESKRDSVTNQAGVNESDFPSRDNEPECHASKTHETVANIELSRCHDSKPPEAEKEAVLL